MYRKNWDIDQMLRHQDHKLSIPEKGTITTEVSSLGRFSTQVLKTCTADWIFYHKTVSDTERGTKLTSEY